MRCLTLPPPFSLLCARPRSKRPVGGIPACGGFGLNVTNWPSAGRRPCARCSLVMLGPPMSYQECDTAYLWAQHSKGGSNTCCLLLPVRCARTCFAFCSPTFSHKCALAVLELPSSSFHDGRPTTAANFSCARLNRRLNTEFRRSCFSLPVATCPKRSAPELMPLPTERMLMVHADVSGCSHV
jgi:hypothetical protein